MGAKRRIRKGLDYKVGVGKEAVRDALGLDTNMETEAEKEEYIILDFIIPNNGYAQIIMGGIDEKIKMAAIKEYFGEYDVIAAIVNENIMINNNVKNIVSKNYLMSLIKSHNLLKHSVSAVKSIHLAEMFIVDEDKNMCMFIIKAYCQMTGD